MPHVDIGSPPPYVPPTRIRLTQAQAKDLAIGENVEISVSGKVVSLSQQKSYDSKKNKDVVTGYEVELEKSSVVDVNMNPAAKALKELKGE
jgi:hypothetical protein